MNKKTLIICLIAGGIILIPLAFSSSLFASDPLSPSETITTYYDHAREGNIDEAKKYISQDVIDQYEDGGTWYATTLKSAIVKEGKAYSEMEPVKEEVEGDTAQVDVRVITDSGREDTERYLLVKEDDSWKITFQ